MSKEKTPLKWEKTAWGNKKTSITICGVTYEFMLCKDGQKLLDFTTPYYGTDLDEKEIKELMSFLKECLREKL